MQVLCKGVHIFCHHCRLMFLKTNIVKYGTLVALKYVKLKILLVCIYYPLFSLHQSDLPLEEMGRHFELGDWKLLYLLSANMEPLVFASALDPEQILGKGVHFFATTVDSFF